MPGVPPLRISNTDGTFNQIPVFELELSGGVLSKLSPTKVQLAIAGAQGPSGPSGTITIGSGVGLGTDNSILFVKGGNLSQDPTNFVYDSGSVAIGLGTDTPDGTFHIVMPSTGKIIVDNTGTQVEESEGIIQVLMTPTAGLTGTRAIELLINANSAGDTKAIEVDYKATNVDSTFEEVAIDILVDKDNSTGGEVDGIRVDQVGETGSARVTALVAGVGVNPIKQDQGVFTNANDVFSIHGTATSQVLGASTDASTNVEILSANNAYLYIGGSAKFEEVEIILSNNAANPGVKPTFQISSAGAGGTSNWVTIEPIDNTNGFRQNGTIDLDDVITPLWSAQTENGNNLFWLRVQRTQASLTTPPAEELIKIATVDTLLWDSDGLISVKGFKLSGTGNMQDNIITNVPLATAGSDVITIDYFEANSQDISGKQDSLTIPLSITSGGTGQNAAGSATALVGMNSSTLTEFDYYQLDGGDSVTVTRTGTSYTVNAVTSDVSGFQDSITIPLSITSGGTGHNVTGSATALIGIHSSDTTRTDYYQLDGGNSVTLTRTGTSYTVDATTSDVSSMVIQGTSVATTYPLAGGGDLSADRTLTVDTAFLVNTGVTLTAGSGLGGGGDLSADRTFSVNTNVRDKTVGFFSAGNLSTDKDSENARIYIPFNMEVYRVEAAVTTAPTDASLIADINLHGTPDAGGTSIFTADSRPTILSTEFIGTTTGFNITTLHAGSYLGFDIDQVGSTVAGSNLTITVITRTS